VLGQLRSCKGGAFGGCTKGVVRAGREVVVAVFVLVLRVYSMDSRRRILLRHTVNTVGMNILISGSCTAVQGWYINSKTNKL
jgi:hypothetical protein